MWEGLAPGQRLARGVCRLLRDCDFAPLLEFSPAPGLRVDVIALGPRGEIWIVECKSSRVDFAADRKWMGYLAWCDRFYWAVDPAFPVDILPDGAGLIFADAYGAEIARHPGDTPLPLPPPRRKALALRFARAAAGRLSLVLDPTPGRAAPALADLPDAP